MNHPVETTPNPAIAGQKVWAAVVTYFPPSGLAARLGAIAALADGMVVVDNSAEPVAAAAVDEAVRAVGGQRIANTENLGIATALNQAVAKARAEGADWVFFFDQDSRPSADFRKVMAEIAADEDPAWPVGIIGCNYDIDATNAAVFPDRADDGKPYLAVDAVITSGSAYRMDMLNRIGRFRDEYFIDCVDTEYCLRALLNGYAVRRSTKVLLRHSLGSPTFHMVLGRRIGTANHSPLRRYYMTRNNVLMARSYWRHLPGATWRSLKGTLITFIVMVVVEQKRPQKVAAILRGLWHGLWRRNAPPTCDAVS